MQKNVRLAIPTPCHEKWDSFAKTKQGGFCGSCQKEVIDFTGWSEERLRDYFRTPAINTCGRFKTEQLKVYTFAEPSSSKMNWLSLTFVSMLLLFSSRQTSALTVGKVKQHTEQLQPEVKTAEPVGVKNDSSIVVQGTVRHAADDSMLPGVNVTRKGTTDKTVTDADGNFQLMLKNPLPSDVLIFEFVGLRTLEYSINRTELNEIKIVMDDDVITLGSTIVLGGVESPRWYSPRRWWWGVKNCFRK